MGVTYVSLAPEHPLVSSLTTPEQSDEVTKYVDTTSSRSDLDRTSSKEKTGVFTGSYCTHPLSGEKVRRREERITAVLEGWDGGMERSDSNLSQSYN